MRKTMVAGNWKMFKTAGEAAILVQNLEDVARECSGDAETVVAPPFTALHSVSTVLALDHPPIKLAAQDMFWEEEGAYTGEVAPRMLTDLGVAYVIVGHSERRQYFGESDEVVNRKARAVFAHAMTPILCCGETLETREADRTADFIAGQIRAGLAGITEADATDLVIAYEPIWAIGTGKTATPEMAEEVCAHIRALVAEVFDDVVAERVRILYGGSVKPENAALFFAQPDIDGALVGGAALTAEAFAPIIKAARA
ncbi:MAG: triose-phosphate isomerase [Coriobacteriia bacterium]|nr:triose-phosphate isomerase [Coriobacteriia bacterium]